jgi:hypothetical protein
VTSRSNPTTESVRAVPSGPSFDPEQLKLIGAAFDEAWADIAPLYADAVGLEAARHRPATALLKLASDGISDKNILRRLATQRFKLDGAK